jgi:hypothetical protein
VIPFDRPETTGNRVVDAIFQRIVTTLQSLKRVVTNDHVVRVTFGAATTDVQVFHGLDAPVDTFEVVDRDADVRVWRSTSVNARPRHLIIMQASAAATVRVRFT